MYCICKFVCGGGEEKAGKASAGDVEIYWRAARQIGGRIEGLEGKIDGRIEELEGKIDAMQSQTNETLAAILKKLEVEAGGNDADRRRVPEKRLAHVVNQMPEGDPPSTHQEDSVKLSDQAAELAREQEALLQQQAELAREQEALL